MPPDPQPSALRRMAGGTAPVAPGAAAARGEAPALARALATAVLRVADGFSGLDLSTGTRAARRLDRADAFDGLDERALCLLVDPPGHDPLSAPGAAAEAVAARTGVVAIDPGLTDALVEAQTIGRVTGPARPPRRPTRIDAALAQPFARGVLEQVLRLAPPGGPEPRPGALRAGAFVAGPATLGLMLTAPEFLRLDLGLRLGDGGRAGTLSLLLPIEPAPRAAEGAPPGEARPWAEAMRAAALDAPVRLEAVLPPLRLPLARMMALKVGDLIPLDPAALADVTLHGGASGVTMPGRKRLPRNASLKARLGQLNGARAVKITALPARSRDEAAAAAFDAPSLFAAPDAAPPPAAAPGDPIGVARALH